MAADGYLTFKRLLRRHAGGVPMGVPASAGCACRAAAPRVIRMILTAGSTVCSPRQAPRGTAGEQSTWTYYHHKSKLIQPWVPAVVDQVHMFSIWKVRGV